MSILTQSLIYLSKGKLKHQQSATVPCFAFQQKPGPQTGSGKVKPLGGELLPLPLPGQSAEAAAQRRRGKYLPVNTMVLLGLQARLLRSSMATEEEVEGETRPTASFLQSQLDLFKDVLKFKKTFFGNFLIDKK